MNSDKPRISVIIPAYNVEQYVEAALESVFAQEVRAYEVIVVNDGSTDSTLDKINQYAHHAELQVITTQNGGQGEARNEGLRRVSGDYIYFFDADDLMDRRLIATISSVIVSQGRLDLVLFSGDEFGDEDMANTSSDDFLRPFAATDLDGNEIVARLVGAGTPSPCLWLFVSKRNLWQDNQLSFKAIIHEDDEVFLRLVLCACHVSVLQDILVHRRIRAMSTTTSGLSSRNVEGLLAVTQTLTRLYEQSGHRPVATRRAIRKRAIRTAQRYARVCRKVGVETDTIAILRCVYTVRSPWLAMLSLLLAITQSVRRLCAGAFSQQPH